MDPNQPFYCFWKDVGLVRLTPQVLGGADVALQALANNISARTYNAFKVNDLPVKLITKREQVVCCLKLRELPIKTTFSLLEGKMVPEFTNNRDFLQGDKIWTPPESMKLHFCVRCQFQPWKAMEIYFFAQHTDDGSTYKLPLPNQYGDGRLCLGDNLGRLSGATLPELLAKVLDLLKNSTWNTDQLPDMAKAKAMFKWNPASGEVVHETEDWTELCTPLNTVAMQEILHD